MQLIHAPLQNSAWEDLQQHCLSIYKNGGVEFARFHVVDPLLRPWFAKRTLADEEQLILNLLSHPVLAATCPRLNSQLPLRQQPVIQRGSVLTLDGEIAQALVRGGAYGCFSGTGLEAKALGQRFCQGLFCDRYEDIELYKTHTAWSSWFGDVLWDCTWIGLDLAENEIWILCISDSD